MGTKTMLDKLTDKYDRLTPYERAVLTLKEVTGRKRKTVLEAVASCKSAWEAYWTEHWRGAILTTTTYAVQSAMGKLAFSLLQERDGEDDTAAFMECRAWLDALRQLERETGAPFGAAAGMLPGPNMLAFFPPDEDAPHAVEYRGLRRLWDSFCERANRTDEHRALPPLPETAQEELDQRAEYIRLAAEAARAAAPTDAAPGGGTAGDFEILWIPDNGRIMPGGPGGELAVDFSRLSEAQVRKVRSFFEAEARGEVDPAHGYDWTPEKTASIN